PRPRPGPGSAAPAGRPAVPGAGCVPGAGWDGAREPAGTPMPRGARVHRGGNAPRVLRRPPRRIGGHRGVRAAPPDVGTVHVIGRDRIEGIMDLNKLTLRS